MSRAGTGVQCIQGPERVQQQRGWMLRALLLAMLGVALADKAPIKGQNHLYGSTSDGPIVETYIGEPTLACTRDMFIPGSWTDHVPGTKNPQQLFGTTYAQKYIYKHQHPTSCENAKFLIHQMDGAYGVGALWPKIGQGLGLAMQMGRVYVVGTLRSHWESNAYCGEDAHYDTCFFLPFSNCTLEQALQGRNISHVPEFNGHLAYTPNASLINSVRRHLRDETDQSTERVIRFDWENYGDMGPNGVPHIFLDLLSKAPIARELYYYWWRAQSIAYIVRPNARSRFQLKIHQELRAKWGPNLPAGTIAVQIRHGDKISEAPDVADHSYLHETSELLRQLPDLSGSVYMVTLVNESISYFLNQPNLTVFYTDVPRLVRATDRQMSVIPEPWEEILNVLLDIHYVLQSEAFVGTLTSNFGRLLDTMRSTVGCRANRQLLDAMHGPFPLEHIKCHTTGHHCVF